MKRPMDLIEHRRRVGWGMFVFGLILAIGWAISAALTWEHVVASHVRLGYLIADVGLVTPLLFLSWFGLTRARPWAPALFLILVGALAYDLVHFGVYLIQERFLSVPTPAYVLLMLALLALLAWLARRELGALGAAAGAGDGAAPEGGVGR